MELLENWITQPPKYTTFRINPLKPFDIKTVENYFNAQAKDLSSTIPSFYLIKPDCLVLERWPEVKADEKPKNEIVVDALCAAAVLRGAHVFAPGVMGLPVKMERRAPSRVSEAQWGILIEFLERNPNLARARGYNNSARGRAESLRLWQEAANLLNAEGSGTTKSPKEWSVYISNYKSKLKKIVADINTDANATGGGPPRATTILSDTDTRFLALLGPGFGRTAPRVMVQPFPDEQPSTSARAESMVLYEVEEVAHGIAVQTVMPASRLPVINEAIYPEGVVLLQNLPSIVCGWVVDAKPNEYILDMCAAPGNKTTHLAEMSSNEAIIIALDKTPQRIEKIKENCKKQGVNCVRAYSFDSAKCCKNDNICKDSGPPFPPNSFDKVLLDAPCSGLGQRPQLMNKMTPKMLESYKFLQRKLMSAAVKVLNVGGKIVYSTCTVTIDENEGMVQWALEKFPCLKLVPADPLYGGPGLPGCGLNDKQRAMVQRFSPEVDPLRSTEPIYRDTIGFFIATFTKS